MTSLQESPKLPPNVRLVSISGVSGIGKTTLAQTLAHRLNEEHSLKHSSLEFHEASIMSVAIRKRMCRLFGITEEEYRDKKEQLRDFMEDYGVLERKLKGDNHMVDIMLEQLSALASSGDLLKTRFVVFISDVRFLSQGMRLNAYPDTLSLQLIPEIAPLPKDLKPTERELDEFEKNIPSLRKIVGLKSTTFPTAKAIINYWMEKETMKNWIAS